MRVVVFSDSHGDFATLRKVVEARPDADLFLHLGDGERDFKQLQKRFPEKEMRFVQGNNDWSGDAEIVDLLRLEGKRILMTHGHTFTVKHGLERLEAYGRGVRADAVLYGHDHIAAIHYEDGLYLINPGSITTVPHGNPSYAMLDITREALVPNIVWIKPERKV